MRCERIEAESAPATASRLRALIPSAESVAGAVAEIVAGVRSGGDVAVLEYTRAFDTGGTEPASLRVEAPELARAADALDPAVRAGLERAIENVREVAAAALPSPSSSSDSPRTPCASAPTPSGAPPCTSPAAARRTRARS